MLFGLVGAAALAAGVAIQYGRTRPAVPRDAAAVLLAATFEDLGGGRRAVGDWRGKVLVVNFWATWCAPCREEIPEFVRLQEQFRDRGVQFVGIAVDQRDAVERFAREFGINYPVLVGSLDAIEVSKAAGNRVGALPFTAILGRDGQLAKVHLGKLDAETLTPVLSQLV
ncbi:MAG TPA: TlpA disulfide reductase family protein [Pelomicrobium sp.]|nr:TlpA disulfide reductase family protein [Pelomicrobium sp.]